MKSHRLGLLITLVIVSLWSALSGFKITSELSLPSPLSVVRALWINWPDIAWHTAATAARALLGFLMATVLGFALGVLMTWNRSWFSLLDVLVESVRPVPAVAAIPFMILWLGPTLETQMLLITLSCGCVIAVDVYTAISTVNPLWIRAAQCLGASRYSLYREILLPVIVPQMSGLRIAAALSFSITVAAEFAGAQWSLGGLIMRARRSLDTETILMSMLIVGILARLTDLLIRATLRRLSPWAEPSILALHGLERKESLS